MRTMRLVARDAQSGGLLAVLLTFCLFFQAFAAPLASAQSEGPALVLCDPLQSGDQGGGDAGLPVGHDCCPGICQAGGCCASPVAQPDLGAAYPGRAHLTPAPPEHAPALAHLAPGPIQPRAPPVSP